MKHQLITAGVALGLFATGCATGGSTNPAASPNGSDRVRSSAAARPVAAESPDPRFVIDRQGRVVILRGENVINSAKGDPAGTGGVDEASIAALGDFGFDVARHLIFWKDIEPEPGHFDDAYLDRVGQRLDWYQAHHVKVILDMHQDIFGTPSGGEGFPDWATITNNNPPPDVGNGPWWVAAASPAAYAAADNFWRPEKGHPELQDHFLKAWQHVVTRFKDHPAVIGYDILNEPTWAVGDLAATLAFRDQATKSGDWTDKTLVDFTQNMVNGIRGVDPDGWIFYEPSSVVNVDVLGGPFPGDLARITDPRPGAPRLVYAPHHYPTALDAGSGYARDNPYVKNWEKLRAADRAKYGSALFIGEFGAGPPNPEADLERLFGDIEDMADRQMIGWTYWVWDKGGWGIRNADNTDAPFAKAISRPYPQAIAGTPTAFGYDTHTDTLTVTFTSRAGTQGSTDIYVGAKRHYPNGWELHVNADTTKWSQTYDATSDTVHVTTDPTIPTYTLCLAPKGAPCPAG